MAGVWGAMPLMIKCGGVMAFWGCSDQVPMNYPKATRMIEAFYYRPHKDAMGSYW
jgi:hypothetical protein